jgi:glycosyltransferase involved in cell wall biosynthesis
VSGVACTSRNFVDYAIRKRRPFLSVRAGKKTALSSNGPLQILELKRGFTAFRLDAELKFDLFFMRYARLAVATAKSFGADLVHVTSPGDVGILGVWTAKRLGVPLVASWHTNVHEFAARRLEKWTRFLPKPLRFRLCAATERFSLGALIRFYSIAEVLLAPNKYLIRMLTDRTGQEVSLMKRGVRSELFSPTYRQRTDSAFILGYAGRFRPEKNLRMLVDIERELIAAGERDYRFLLVGDGSERAWLERSLLRAEFTGFLEGDALARAFANMDLFVFPSETDTYGNVILEAMASGVPAVVTDRGGPQTLVQPGKTGFVASGVRGFSATIHNLMQNRDLQKRMGEAARRRASSMSWDSVFEEVYQAYSRVGVRPEASAAAGGRKGNSGRRSDAILAD